MKTSLTPVEIATMAILAGAADELRKVGEHPMAQHLNRLLADYVQAATSEAIEE